MRGLFGRGAVLNARIGSVRQAACRAVRCLQWRRAAPAAGSLNFVPILILCLGLLACAGQRTAPDDPRAGLTPAAWKNAADEWASPALDWSSFADSKLAELIGLALDQNPDIASALEALNASRLQLEEAQVARRPLYSIESSVAGDEARGRPAADSYALSGRASYELDLWGRRRDDVRIAELDLVAAQAALLTARISLASEVADAYYNLRVLDQRLKFEQETLNHALSQQRQILARHEAGVISGIEVNNQEVEVQRLRSQIEDTKGQRSLQEDRLATLTGRPPQSFRMAAAPALALPAIRLAPDIPAEVLRARPDIRAAEARLQASEVRLEQARKAFYPSISLSGSSGLASGSLSDLVRDASWNWQIGADFLATLLDNGARGRRVESARIAAAAQLAAYRKAILAALQDVERALNQQETNLRQYQIQQLQLAAQERLTRETEARYRLGALSGFELVRQQRSLILQREQILNTQLAGIQATIQLFRAVGVAP